MATLMTAVLAAACSGGGGGGGSSVVAPGQVSYGRNPAFYAAGIVIDVNHPTVQGLVGAWSIQPALPAGLSFDKRTGDITGTPAAAVPRAKYRVTAANNAGSSGVDLFLEVVRPTRVAIAGNTADDTLTTYVVDPFTGRLWPRGYVRANPGEMSPRGITVHEGASVVYVLNTLSANISLYDFDRSSGRLKARSVVATPGAQPTELILHPLLDVAYVIGKNAPQVSTFAVDPVTGDLTLLGSTASAAGSETAVVNGAGTFLYVANTGNRSLSTFALDAATGLPSTAGPLVATGKAPFSLQLGARDRFVYVLNLRSNSIDVFALDAVSGRPTFVASEATGILPARIVFEPTRRFLYSAISSDDTLRTYAADPDTGRLTEIHPPTPTGERPASVVVDPSGSYLYASGIDGPDVTAFAIDHDSGVLTEICRARARSQPRHLALVGGHQATTPRPKFAYVANRTSNEISQYSTQAGTGTLGMTSAPALTGSAPRSVATDPWTRYVYTGNGATDDVSAFGIDPITGALSSLGPATPAGTQPHGATVESSGRFLYVANCGSNDVSAFSIDDGTGALTLMETEPAGGQPAAIHAERTGRFVYVASQGTKDIHGFSIDPVTGELTPTGSVVTAGSPRAIDTDGSGRFLYAALEDVDLVAGYEIDAQTGTLSLIGSWITGVQPTSVAVDPLGRYVYTVDHDSGAIGSISSFTLDPATGALSPLGRFLAGVNPIAATVSPMGRFLYVANEGSDDITLLLINASNGVLNLTQTVPAGVAPSAIAVAIELE